MDSSGSQRERELNNQLVQDGFGVIRSPGSGGGTSLPRPDIFYCVAPGVLVAGEMKYAKHGTERKYVQSEEIAGIREFADQWYAIPVVIHRWSRDTTYYVIPLDVIDEDEFTRTGNLPLVRDERAEDMTIDQYNTMLVDG